MRVDDEAPFSVQRLQRAPGDRDQARDVSHQRADVQDEYIREMRAQLARGIILIGAVNSPALDEARAAGATLVFVNRPDPGDPSSPYVGIDNAAAAAEIADRLLERGVRRIGVLHASLDRTAAYWPCRDCSSRLNAAGVDTSSIQRASGPGLDYIAIGYRGMGELLERAGLSPDRGVLQRPAGLRRLSQGARGLAGCPRRRRILRLRRQPDQPLDRRLAQLRARAGRPLRPAIVATLHRLWRSEPPPPLYLEHRLTIRDRRLPGEDRPAASVRQGRAWRLTVHLPRP